MLNYLFINPSNLEIQVCLSPALLNLYEIENRTVVVTDVLRATSTMVSALEVGVKKILPVASRAEALEYIGKENHLVAGERDGKKVEGFDLGNSPLSIQREQELVKDKVLVMTTTNGTKALKQSETAKHIYIGALSNVSAIAKEVMSLNQDILVVCAGWKNRINLEDTLFAGSLCEAVKQQVKIYGDAAIMSQQLYNAHKSDLLHAIKCATHYQRLKSHGIEDDIAFCMTENSSTLVPVLENGFIIAK